MLYRLQNTLFVFLL